MILPQMKEMAAGKGKQGAVDAAETSMSQIARRPMFVVVDTLRRVCGHQCCVSHAHPQSIRYSTFICNTSRPQLEPHHAHAQTCTSDREGFISVARAAAHLIRWRAPATPGSSLRPVARDSFFPTGKALVPAPCTSFPPLLPLALFPATRFPLELAS